MHGTRSVAVVFALFAAAALGACSSTPEETATLTDSKGLVQLVRNEAGERLPAEDVADVQLSDDGSEACQSEADDPEGLERRWASTLLVTLTEAAGENLEAGFSDLIESFVGNGWSKVSYGGGGAVTLEKPGSDASILFTASKADVDAATAPSISITIHSGCVVTAGAESDEVTQLESVDAE